MELKRTLLVWTLCAWAAPLNAQPSYRSVGHSTYHPAPPAAASPGVTFQPHDAAMASEAWQALDTLEAFVGIDGSKQPQDFGVNAQFGGRAHVNWGIPIVPDIGLGLQVGTALNVSDHAVRVTSQIYGSGSRTQSFSTIGLFQRTDSGWTWGVAHDFLYERDYDDFSLTQWRGRIGYFVTECDEIGVFGMLPQKDDRGLWGPVPVELSALAQGNIFWRHTWEHSAQTGFWIGVSEGHSRANAALGDPSPTSERLVFGSDLHLPLNDSWAIFGEANFITPADTGTVDAYLGFAYYPGGGARGFRQRRFAPVLPVANNTSFSVNLER